MLIPKEPKIKEINAKAMFKRSIVVGYRKMDMIAEEDMMKTMGFNHFLEQQNAFIQM